MTVGSNNKIQQYIFFGKSREIPIKRGKLFPPALHQICALNPPFGWELRPVQNISTVPLPSHSPCLSTLPIAFASPTPEFTHFYPESTRFVFKLKFHNIKIKIIIIKIIIIIIYKFIFIYFVYFLSYTIQLYYMLKNYIINFINKFGM